jgi:aspartate racemase
MTLIKPIKPTLGVVGGMGVQATALFYDIITGLQTVTAEQEYIDILVYSKPSIPDRTTYILDSTKPSPVPHLINAVQLLERAGVCRIAIPCVTSHVFYSELAAAVVIPIIDIMAETAKAVVKAGYSKVGLLATDGTLKAKLFQNALAPFGIDVFEPKPKKQTELMEYIYNIKKGRPYDPAVLEVLADGMKKSGAQSIIAGCTELSVALKGCSPGYIDPMTALAHAAISAIKPS